MPKAIPNPKEVAHKERIADMHEALSYHVMGDDQQARSETLRDAAKEFASVLADTTPVCSEASIAFSRFQECLMWANKAIARDIPVALNVEETHR